MSWTKRQFIEQAFEELGLAAYVFDLTPEQIQSALRRLDSMMATWNAKGIRLGYPIPSSPQNSNSTDETQVPDAANEAIYTNLALRIAPSFGKTPSTELKGNAKACYDLLLMRASLPPEQQLAALPSGAGNKPTNSETQFITPAPEPLKVGEDGYLNFN